MSPGCAVCMAVVICAADETKYSVAQTRPPAKAVTRRKQLDSRQDKTEQLDIMAGLVVLIAYCRTVACRPSEPNSMTSESVGPSICTVIPEVRKLAYLMGACHVV